MSKIVTEEQLREVFAQARTIDGDTNFFEAGLTSRALAEIVTRLDAVGLPVKLVDLYRFPTVRALVAEVNRRADPGTDQSVRPGLPWATTGK